MRSVDRLFGHYGLHHSRFHDEKRHRVALRRSPELFLAATFRITQRFIDRPYLPWLPFEVIQRISELLSRDSRVLEFGSGRSTVWLSKHAGSVLSIEHDDLWYHKMSALFARQDIDNVDYRLRHSSNYWSLEQSVGQFDFIIVDGINRHECVRATRSLLRPGGHLYLDNSDKDMTIPNGDVRLAEAAMIAMAGEWRSSLEYVVGYPPGVLFPHEGVFLRRP